MTESNNSDELQKALSKFGCEEGKEYKITLTKELKIEPVVPYMSLENVLPYPLSTEGSCPICKQDYRLHTYLDYFINPQHNLAVRNYLVLLQDKHKRSKSMYQKLGVEAPDSVLSPRDMALLLREDAKENPEIVNWEFYVFEHFTPSESEKWESKISAAQSLHEISVQYDGFCDLWEADLLIHKHENTIEMAEAHKIKLQDNYKRVQSDFHRVTANVFAYEKQADEFGKALSPLRMAVSESMRKRRERATLPFGLLVPRSSKKSARPQQQQQQSQKEW